MIMMIMIIKIQHHKCCKELVCDDDRWTGPSSSGGLLLLLLFDKEKILVEIKADVLGVGLQEKEDQIPVVVLIKRHRIQILLDHACNRLGNGPVLGDVYDVKVVGDFCVVVPEESKFRVGWRVKERDACTPDTLADRRDYDFGQVAQTQDLLDHLAALEEAIERSKHFG